VSKNRPATEFDLTTLEMFVLDVLRHDAAEQIASIVRMLNDRGCIGWRDRWPHDFTEDEVRVALNELAEHGDVEVLNESAGGGLVAAKPRRIRRAKNDDSCAAAWYRLTPAGRATWDRWEPPANMRSDD